MQPETAEGAVLRGWEERFAQSGHPLAGAVHGIVDLAELEARSREADYLYSASTFALLDEARTLAEVRTIAKGREPPCRVVRLAEVAACLLLRVHPKLATSRPSHAIERSLGDALQTFAVTPALDAIARRRQGKSPEPLGDERFVLAPELVDTLALAAHLGRGGKAAGVPRVNLARVVLALLLLPEGRKLVFAHFLEGGEPRTTRRIDELILKLVEEHLGEPSLVPVIARELDAAARGTAPEPPPEPRLPDYVADRPIEKLGDDLLNFRDDARAVAEIICQREPGPPLAIGLFGEWGSGKSSFMHLLRLEIDELAAQARAAAGDSTFIRRADHIVFNAWQYNDAQLWPVLAEFTFAQLRAGGAEQLSAKLADEVYGQLEKRVSESEDKAEDLALQLMKTQRTETETRDTLLQAEADRDQALADTRKAAIAAVAGHLELDAEPGEAAPGRGRAIAAAAVDATAERLTSATGALATLWTALDLAWRHRRDRLLLAVAVLVALATILVATSLQDRLLGLVVSVLPAAFWFTRSVAPLLQALGRYREAQDQAERAYRARARDAEIELARLQRDIRFKENEIKRELAKAAHFKGRTPAQVLEFFLSESAVVSGLQGEVGVVSRVRRAFAQLDAVLARHAASGDTPERLIFYIDDLDRCRAEQVVRVLEAVHLLLAFEHFVVIVGVDTRWLETSLMSYYDEQLRGNRTAAPGRDPTAPDPRATVRDYVEKIFQVPVQIPHLTTEADGTFARLVDRLCPTPLEEEEPGGGPTTAPASAASRVTAIRPLELTIEAPERFRAALARARLTRPEVALLQQLGPLAGRSPRGVKRLVNLYRLVRATRVGARLRAFLDGDTTTGGKPDYPGVQLCLAVEVGLGADQVYRFREAVFAASREPGVRPSDVLVQPLDAGRSWAKPMRAFRAALLPTQGPESVDRLLRTIVDSFGDTPERLQDLCRIVLETTRFSFSPLADQHWPGRPDPAPREAGASTDRPKPPARKRRQGTSTAAAGATPARS